ncbi:4Fe-4S binding protein [uncultured Phascolarctobacterium sp.]|uniref:4Fe-4S binding protein n=1 Tax=uncultured Phascolarctobacterium sp. TaxID=512296 RepID=UPI00260F603A|nr:4Fe-4S binding protein [uncultured Phascolarctobacterium sp.]
MNSKLFYLQRLLGYCLGFVLFYEPFMLFGKLTESFFVETGFTSIHVPCARIPLANVLTGEWLASGPTSLFFCLLLAATSLWFGPLFCGRLCPAGGFSEFLSRLLPDKYKIDWSKYVPILPLRCGFFAGFLFSVLLGLGAPCVYCNYYALELFAGFLHTGHLLGASVSLMLTFFVCYIILGLFTKGGRGYCNLLCPVGAMCSAFHAAGSCLPGTFKMQVDKSGCVGCGICANQCPMRAISVKNGKAAIDIRHCIVCGQCAHKCPKHAIKYLSNIQVKEEQQ